MAVQVLPPTQTFGQSLAQALGGAASNIGQGFIERNQRLNDEKILAHLSDEGSNLSPMQKVMQIAKLSARTQKPVLDLAKPLLAQQSEQDLVNDQLRRFGLIPGGQQNDQPGQPGGLSAAHLTDQQLKGMLTVPALKAFAQAELKGRADQREQEDKLTFDKLSSGKFGEGFTAIMDHDDATFNQIISDPDVTPTVKKQLTDLRNQIQTRMDVRTAERRHQRTEVAEAYKNRIKLLQDELEGARFDERGPIRDRIKKMQENQKKDVKTLAKDPDAFSDLLIWNDEEAEQPTARAKFDPSNPSHKAKAEELYRQYKDKEKVRQILSQEFEF